MKKKAFYIILAGILLTAAICRLYGIDRQPLLEYEPHAIQGAKDYVEMGLLPNVMWWHPPLRNLFIYLSTDVFGNNSIGARFFSSLFGNLTILLMAMLAYEIWNDRKVALISAFFLAVDPLHITFSRQAIQETHVAFFSVLGVYMTVRYVKNDSLLSLTTAGAAFGLGLASKWQAAFVLAACWILVIWPKMIDEERISGRPLHLRLFAAVSNLVLLPSAIYFLTYLPWLLRGYDLSEWIYMQKVSYLWQKDTTLSFDLESNPARAIDWFIRLVGYADIVTVDRPYLTVSINNLLVWWLVLPSFAYIGYRAKKDGLGPAIFVSILFWFSYLPFIVVPRPVWLLTATSVIPFAFLGVSWAMSEIKGIYRMGNGWLYGYLAAVLFISMTLLPLTCGKAFDYPYLIPIINRFSPHMEGGQVP